MHVYIYTVCMYWAYSLNMLGTYFIWLLMCVNSSVLIICSLQSENFFSSLFHFALIYSLLFWSMILMSEVYYLMLVYHRLYAAILFRFCCLVVVSSYVILRQQYSIFKSCLRLMGSSFSLLNLSCFTGVKYIVCKKLSNKTFKHRPKTSSSM